MSELVIIGGGFAGLKAALSAAYENKEHNGDIQISLISQNDSLVIRPRLYQNDPAAMKVALEPILEPLGINFIQGIVSEIDPSNKRVAINKSPLLEISVNYNQLVVAAGSVVKTPPVPGLAEHSFNIDSYEAAIEFDNHVLKAARLPDMAGHNCFVILGAGITGIELATELRSRIAAHSNAETAGNIEIVLIDQANHIGPTPESNAQAVYEQALQEANVTVKLGQTITEVSRTSVTLADGEQIETASVIVTAGLQANPLADLFDVDKDDLGRLIVDDSLRVKGIKNIFAAGDIAAAATDADHVTLMSCQHAMPMGAHAGYNAAHSMLGLPHRKFSQPNYLTCIDLGLSGGLLTKGWDRQVEKTGDEAKALKKNINKNRIYPPAGSAENILAHSHIDAQWADSRE